jgi:acetone carboxylase gamma subunit
MEGLKFVRLIFFVHQGNPLWIIGLDAPVVKIHILKCQNFRKKFFECTSTYSRCAYKPSWEKKASFATCAKKDNFQCYKIIFHESFFNFFLTTLHICFPHGMFKEM